jgi:imidazolonepropionase-like amidohydrolase
LRVAAHASTDEGARNAIEGGVTSLEPGLFWTDETIELIQRSGVFVIPGLDTVEMLNERRIANAEGRYRQRAGELKRLFQAGVRIAYGSDVGIFVPGKTRGNLAASILENYVEVGMPARATLQAMTTNAALMLGVENERGAIKVGLAADIIATPQSPLDDILALQNVNFVMKEGKVFKSPRSPM